MADIFDSHASSYSEDIDKTLRKYGASHDFFTFHKACLIRDLVTEHGKRLDECRVLDVGCGVGKIHRYLAPECAEISGVDVSEASIEIARSTNPDLQYLTYDGFALPFPAESVDISIAIGVFHHVPPVRWGTLASEMMRVLRPTGLSLVIEHNPFNPLTRRIVNSCELDRDAVLLRPSKLRGVFREAGAPSVTSRTILSVPPKGRVLNKLDRTLGVLPFGAQYYVVCSKSRS